MLKFIIYEWKYWMRSPMTWILLMVNALLTLLSTSIESFIIGGSVGSIHLNSPFAIQNSYGFMSLLNIFIAVAFMNATAVRDFQYNTYQLVFSSPIKKRDYFLGKFVGCVSIAILTLLGVSIGCLLGPLMPWAEDATRYGDIIWSGHIQGIIGFAIPNVIISGALLFSLAMLFRSSLVSFVGAMAILVLYSIAREYTQDIANEWLANMLDPFGLQPFRFLSKYMSVDEKNTLALPVTGIFLWNRLLWIGISLLLLSVMYLRFSFSAKKEKFRKEKTATAQPTLPTSSQREFKASKSGKWSWAAFAKLTKFELATVIRNPVFVVLMVIGMINLILSLTSVTTRYGGKAYPVTYDIIETIQGSFYIFLVAIIIFYTGVLVFKEREAKFHEIQDATPVKSSLLFLSKLFAVILTVALILTSAIVIGMIAQLCYGYSRLEPEVYVQRLLVSNLLAFSYLIIAALFFHNLINNKYVAYLAFIVFLALNTFVWSSLEIETNMVQYGGTPHIIYSDMNGFGPFILGSVWYNIYWFLFAILLGFVVFSLYVRGQETAFRTRLQHAGKVLKRNLSLIAVVATMFIICSGFVYYNTKVLNKYDSGDETEEMLVDYEKKYKKYENAAQPRWTALDYHIDIFPHERGLKVTTDAWLKNVSASSISELYLNIPSIAEDSIRITVPNSTIKLDDKKLDFRIVTLQQPMKPGDSMRVQVQFEAKAKGFENEVSFTQLTGNGTFFKNMDIMPTLGYNRDAELSDKNKRKEHKLPVRRKTAALDESNTAARMNNYVINDADWVSVNTTISTSSDQVAVAPGSLVKQWKEGDRNYYNYKLDKQSLNFYSFISARYEVSREKWNGIDIEVYYHKDHAYNVPNMLNSVRKSLAYYTTHFGPYYHKQARIIEFPRYADFAQAFPGTMPYSEGIGFITDLRDVSKDDIDFVFYVVAHEMGHQFWAHQLCGAAMQGSEMMSEGFAQYSALMVMEKEYGKDKMQKFLKYEMDGYLRGRSREFEAERPLIRTEGQQYIHYQKASVILYYLKEMIGEDKVNSAMHSLIDSFAYRQPPYPTAMSALRAFRSVTPDSLQYMVTDLFEKITLFSNRVTDVDYKQVGKEYEVTIKTTSEKFYSDSLGKETKAPLNDLLDIGVFSEPKGDAKTGKPLMMQRVRVNKKDNSYVFRVKEKPYQVGIDPYNYLVDRLPDDNLKKLN